MRIGITYTGSEPKHNNYKNWIQGTDNIDVVKLAEEENNFQEVKTCDGIVLSGGIDIHPQFYNNITGYPFAPEPFNVKRDAFEIAIFEKTQALNIPVLAICRGMQLVNCVFGGDLQQDLGQKNAVHKITDTADKVHGVKTKPDSLIHEIIGGELFAVNSAHHQAIGKLGNGLKITALSEDGIPEVLERTEIKDAPFLFCVQWHPERMYMFGLQDTAASKGVRQKFLEAIRK